MILDKIADQPILVVGDGKLAYSVVINMLVVGHEVSLLTSDTTAAHLAIRQHAPERISKLDLLVQLPDEIPYPLVVVVNGESAEEKISLIHQLECRISDAAVIAVNTDSIPLKELQAGSRVPGRIIGLNWAYPAQTTFFSEIIHNAASISECVRLLEKLAKEKWGKKPYTVGAGFSVRGRMFAAMAREAAFLVEHGYASVESVDRACRNDAGYYLPFSGNFRYMDLMGTYAYGMVMKELNPDLSNAKQLPSFFQELLDANKLGVAVGEGFYQYQMDSVNDWETCFQAFSKEIKALMQKYNHEEAIDR